MIFKVANVDELSLLINFNKKLFPKRNMIRESISYRFIKNPFAKGLDSIICVDDGKIVGQFLLMPCQFKFKNEIHKSYWGMDYITSIETRRTAVGSILCMKAIKEKIHFGVGLSPISLKIHKALKEKDIGAVNKYLKINFSLNVLKSIFYKKNNFYPPKISFNDKNFFLVKDPGEIKSSDGYWGKNELEFSRNEKFLKWRFFYYEDKYILYRLKN